jgi:hypothetical protein
MKKPVLTVALATVLVLGGSAVAVAATSTSNSVARLLSAESNVIAVLHQYKPTAAWRIDFKDAEATQGADLAKVNADLLPAPAPPSTSTGHHLTQQQQSAVAAANQYLSISAFSRLGLIDQLDSPDGSGYSVNDATVAVDSLTVNWNIEAVEAAKAYLAISPFSCNGLIQQLDSPDGGQFTVAQATYGAQHAGDC